LLGGYESCGSQGLRNSPLAEVLRVVFSPGQQPQSEKPFTLTLTEKGREHPMFTLGLDRIQGLKRWQEAPPLDGMPLVARARPGADVLAVNPEVMQEGKPAVALAVQRAPGGGQVMVLCPDTTWKWSRNARIVGQEDTLYSRFWSQAIRWLAGRSLEDPRPMVSVRLEKPVYDLKSKVTVRVVRQRRPGADLGATQFKVDITDPKGVPVPGLVLRLSTADPDEATVEFSPDLAGRYEIQAALESEGKVLANQASEVRIKGRDLELADSGTRPDHLRTLSGISGGVYADMEDAQEIAERIPRSEKRTVRTQRSEYWDSGWLFAAFLIAVSGEWFLRRWNHLV
jgi:hypothetical protein